MTARRLPVRNPAFEYADDLDPTWNRRFPELAMAANSVSLIMPYAEPYFIRCVRSTLPDLEPELRGRTEDFLHQETQHYRHHRQFNDLVARRYPGVMRIERAMSAAYGWLGRTRSQKFNLAFIAGSESIAYSIARWCEQRLGTLFSGAEPTVATLFLWHLAEEVEHKTEAFDVWQARDGSRLRYFLGTSLSLFLLFWFVWLSTLTMLKGDGRLFSPAAHFRLLRWSVSLGMVVLPTITVSALPGHHPSGFTDPVFLPTWLAEFDSETRTLPVPGVVTGG